jgi:peptidoglycan-associated lipoprotein
MKKLFILFVGLIVFGCQKNGSTWDNIKTSGRYMNKSIDELFGKKYNAHQKELDDAFAKSFDDFIPLCDRDLRTQFTTTDLAVPQPRFALGDRRSGIPGIEKFQTPKEELAEIFKTLHFDTDDHILRLKEDLIAVQKIAHFLKKNSKYLVIIEGHCDERSSAGYNMALGTRRANYVRALLVKNGVDFNRIYTISYGKERPLSLGHNSEDWKVNRRAQFKIHNKI